MNNSGHLIFNEDLKTILLGVKSEDVITDAVRKFAVTKNLLEKKEFHITIVGRETGEKLLAENIDFNKIKELVESFEWQFSLNQEFYFITKSYPDEQRSSVIEIVQLPDLLGFYEQLNQLTGQNFALPFSHVTLFTNSTKQENQLRGIGIYSEAEMKDLSPELVQITT